MRSALTLFLLMSALCVHAEKSPTIVVTSKDVHRGSVRITTQSTNEFQNVVFFFAGKTPEEIEKIVMRHPRVQIMQNGIVVTETDRGCSPLRDGKTKKYLGLVLLFFSYEEAKTAVKALRGD